MLSAATSLLHSSFSLPLALLSFSPCDSISTDRQAPRVHDPSGWAAWQLWRSRGCLFLVVAAPVARQQQAEPRRRGGHLLRLGGLGGNGGSTHSFTSSSFTFSSFSPSPSSCHAIEGSLSPGCPGSLTAVDVLQGGGGLGGGLGGRLVLTRGAERPPLRWRSRSASAAAAAAAAAALQGLWRQLRPFVAHAVAADDSSDVSAPVSAAATGGSLEVARLGGQGPVPPSSRRSVVVGALGWRGKEQR